MRLVALAAFFFLIGETLWGAGTASAARFGKYHLTGSIGAEFKKEQENSAGSDSDFSSFEHKYKLDVSSFVLSPRLLTYQLGVSLTKGTTKTKGDSSDIDNLGYNANTEIFAGRPFATSLFTNRDTTQTVTPAISSAGSSLVTQTSTMRGAMMQLNYKIFPTTISIDEELQEGTSGAQRIDRTVRNVRLNAHKDVYGFSGRYAYAYTDTEDNTEHRDTSVTSSLNRGSSTAHEATAYLEKNFSPTMNLREDIRFTSTKSRDVGQNILTGRVTEKSTNYTLTTADETVTFNAVAGNLTATLPTAVGKAGVIFSIVKIDASVNTVTVTPSGVETIGGASSLILAAQWSSVTIKGNGVNWDIESVNSSPLNPTPLRNTKDTNINSNTFLRYRPSENFSNDTSVNLYYFERQDAGQNTVQGTNTKGWNALVNNNTIYQINPEWSLNGALGGSYYDTGGDNKTISENVSGTLNYLKAVSGWNLRVAPTAGVILSQETNNEDRKTENIGLSTSADKNFPWLNSNLRFGASTGKTYSSPGGDTSNWQLNAGWNAAPTERLQLQSTVRYLVEDSRSDTLTITAAGASTLQSDKRTSKTMSVDLNYFWNVYVSENKQVNINGGGVWNDQKSESAGSGSGGAGGSGSTSSTTESTFLYSQILFRAVPLRSLFFDCSLRGEWNRTNLETVPPTADSRLSPERTAYIWETSINWRVRRIFVELKQSWRQENSFGIPYDKQTFSLKIVRPF